MQSSVSQLFESIGEDGYGGMDPDLYRSIVEFKKTGHYPPFIEDNQKVNRNAQFHWRIRCSRFVLSVSDTLLYVEKQNSDRTRIVVKRGEVRVAIKVLHERSGHAGQKHTQMFIARRLYWSGIRRDVTRYVNECNFCKTKRDLRKPALFEDHTLMSALRSEEANIADRLLLNVAEPIYEYVDEAYEEVVMDEMDDSLLFPQDQSQYENEKELNVLLSEKVEVGAEELISSSDVLMKRSLDGRDPSPLRDQPCSSRMHSHPDRRRIHQDPLLSSEVHPQGKRRKTYQSAVPNQHHSRFEQDQQGTASFMEAYSVQQSSPTPNNTTHQFPLDGGVSMGGPAMMMAPMDSEVARMQKSVLQVQYEVLTLKKELLQEKLKRVRQQNTCDHSVDVEQ